MILLKSVCLEDSRPFLLCITHSLVHRQRLHLLLYWPDNGDFVWFVESDVVTWRHHLGIISDWLFQGFLSLHCNWLDGTLTSILLIGWKTCLPNGVIACFEHLTRFFISFYSFQDGETLYSFLRYPDFFMLSGSVSCIFLLACFHGTIRTECFSFWGFLVVQTNISIEIYWLHS